MQKALAPAVTTHIKLIRRYSKLPVAIGFGVSNPRQARAAASAADAVVVGSAIVNQIGQRRSPAQVARFVAVMVKAVKR